MPAEGQEVASMFVKIGADITGLQSGMSAAMSMVKNFGSMVAIGFATTAVYEFGKKAVEAASEAQQAEVRFAETLGTLGIKYEDVSEQASRYFTKLERLSGFQDDDLQKSTVRLMQITGDYGKSLRLTALAADFARGAHIELEQATNLVGKASEGNITMLKKMYPELLKNASASDALALLQRKFAGDGAIYMETYAGKVDLLKARFNNLQEVIGRDMIFSLGLLGGAFEKALEKGEKFFSSKWGERLMFGLMSAVPGLNLLVMGVQKLDKEAKKSFDDIAKNGNDAARKAAQSFDAFGASVRSTLNTIGQDMASTFATNVEQMTDIFGHGTETMAAAFNKLIDDMVEKIIMSGILTLISFIFGGAPTGILAGLFPKSAADAPGGGGIPHFADGGIVGSPTLAMVGEGGESEAIIPLSKLQSVTGGGSSTQHIYVTMPSMLNTMDPATARASIQQVANHLKGIGVFKPT